MSWQTVESEARFRTVFLWQALGALLVAVVVTCIPGIGEVSTWNSRIETVWVQDVTDTTAQVTWTLDHPSTGQVEYGITKAYGQYSTPEMSYEYLTHVQVLTDLHPDTLYHFRVISTTGSGATSVSGDHSFQTLLSVAALNPPQVDPDGIQMPTSIDSSGGSDVADALQRFVDGVPNGSTIVFRSGGTYRMSHSLRLTGRRDLLFEGNGATLQATGPGHLVTASPFLIEGGSQRITLRNLTLVGNNAEAGTADAYHSGAENQMSVAIYGSSDIEFDNVTMRRAYGDCIHISSGAAQTWSERIRIHDSDCTLGGRHGVGLIAGRDVTIERVRFDGIGMFIIDIEPDEAWEGAANVLVRDNTIGSYGLTRLYTSWVLAAEGAAGSTVRQVSLVGNSITGNPCSGHEGKALALHVTVRDRGPREDFVVRDNISTMPVAGPSLHFVGVEGVTVTGNRQPLTSGELATFPGSSDITYDSEPQVRAGRHLC